MRFIYMIPAALLAPAIHEWVKALCSALQGDQTPRNTGRLTLNPFKHFEPVGFMFILLFGFGWGKPVDTTALHYKDRQRGVIVTYITPVLISLILGLVSAALVAILAGGGGDGLIPLRIVFSQLVFFPFLPPDLHSLGMILLAHFALININLAIFNLIPVYPLAANHILLRLSRPDTIARLTHYEKPLQIILILFLLFEIAERVIVPISMRIIVFAWGIVA